MHYDGQYKYLELAINNVCLYSSAIEISRSKLINLSYDNRREIEPELNMSI